MKERTIIVTLTTDTEEDLAFIRRDIETELNCACCSFDVVDVREAESALAEQNTQPHFRQ